MTISREIFRAYDIRGVVDKTLTEDAVYAIGQAFGTKVQKAKHGIKKVVVARDGRLSGQRLQEKLVAGINSTGCDVVIINQVPTPILYFACKHLRIPSGIMITGSHNPPDYNGLKMILDDQAIYGDAILELMNIISKQDYVLGAKGIVTNENLFDAYIDAVSNASLEHHPMKVVVDAGNGITGPVIPLLLRGLGHEVIELHCEVDGTFPNHHPDPGNPENLRDTIKAIKEHNADIGLAFDGDGDRLGVVDENGKIIWPDRVLMPLAESILEQNPDRTVIYDIKSSQHLDRIISNANGKPLMWKTGHSLIKAKMHETNAVLAGEMSGHIFIKDRWFGFDDGLYAAARVLELLSSKHMSASKLFEQYPENLATPEIPVPVSEENKFDIVSKMIAKAEFPGAKISTLDGIRVDFPDSWGLVRASNTTPNLIIRFEAESQNAFKSIKDKMRKLLSIVEPSLALSF